VTDQLGAQGTICAGGRFDGLVEQLGGKATPSAGFAIGLERLLALVRENLQPDNRPHLYLVLVGDAAQKKGVLLAEQLRDAIPVVRIMTNCGGGSFKSQFKKADKCGAQFALVLGEDEVTQKTVSIKFLRGEHSQNQETLAQDDLPAWLEGKLTNI